MCRSSDSPDGILLDKAKKLDSNETNSDSFFLALKEPNNSNSKLQEGIVARGPLKMPI
jgi:hypothetical protein